MKFSKDIARGREKFAPLPEQLVLKSARVIDPEQGIDDLFDLAIENGVIKSVEKDATISPDFSGEVLDLSGKVITPGWLDLHAHLREPGREDEETIESGALAAANGGFTAVCCMSDTNPAIDTQEIIQYIKDRARGLLVEVLPVAAATKKREGQELTEILDLVGQGAAAISDDPHPILKSEIMRRVLEYSRMIPIPVIVNAEDASMTGKGYLHEGFVSTRLGLGGMPSVAEDLMIGRDLLLSEYTGGLLHISHISTKKAVELIHGAKQRGVKVTADVTPHHLALTDEAVLGFDTNTKVNPPLRSEEDRQALIEGLRKGIIDVIASDHSPHSWEEKASEFIYAPFGVVGLETALSVASTVLCHQAGMDIKELIPKFAVNPYRVLGKTPPAVAAGQPANLTILDPSARWTLSEKNLLSKSHNTPFIGWEMQGKPFGVINKGQMFFSAR